jgi:hypothetical protein
MASTIKVNNIQNQCGANIANKCGTTITLGASGDTITLACGASQTGFGRTGTVDWDTTAKTASFTAVSGNGYFVNTTSAAITLTLPATPSAGDIVAFKDYAFTFATNNLTVDGNGSPIGGVDGIINPTYNTNGTSKTFIYVDGTKGWLVTNESTDTSQESNAAYVAATGGTIVTCGDYKAHIFTGPGTFCVSCAGNACGSNTLDYLVVAGGGSSGGDNGGGGGAGGFRLSNSYSLPAPTTSPLANPTGITATVTAYPITVGAGGAGAGGPSGNTGPNGSNSVFSTIISAGGGFGGGSTGPLPNSYPGNTGGSGGGAKDTGRTGAAGNTPPVSPPQGNPGGNANPSYGGGGGGGAGAAGSPGGIPSPGGPGGIGSYINNTFIGPTAPSYGTPGPVGSTRYFAGGGGGGVQPGCNAGLQGSGGAGGGADSGCGTNDGTTNTGGGAGSGNPGPAPVSSISASGGSGIVIIRYKYQ